MSIKPSLSAFALFAFVLYSLSLPVAANMLAADHQLQLTLADGQLINAVPSGNAQRQWLTTEDGRAIVKRQGIWYLADISAQQVLSTGVPLASGLPTVPAERSSSSVLRNRTRIGVNDGSSHVAFSFAEQRRGFDQRLLVLRVSFANQSFEFGREDFQQLMFEHNADDQLSVHEYYLENSYQKFRIQPAAERQGRIDDGIVDVTLDYNHPNFGADYGAISKSLVRDALAKANPFIDYDSFDQNRDGLLAANELGIVLMIAGYENAYGGAGAPEPRVWAHKSDIAGFQQDGVTFSFYAMFGEKHQDRMATIGIICHELGHLLFNLPDLYDRQGNSNGIGRWGLMGLGSWNSGSEGVGSSPAHMLAWSKERAGFLEPKDLEGESARLEISSTTLSPDAARIWLDPFRHSEHFLVEYRSRDKADKGLPGQGVLITHADNWVGVGEYGAQNDVSEHKLVDIEEADGRSDLDDMSNRGDQYDVFNPDYGQAYFGSSSLPASVDYRGTESGVEITSISIEEYATANVTLPYKKLGNNLGYDDGGIVSPWGNINRESAIVIRFEMDQVMNWLHGIDLYSHGNGHADIRVYGDFYQGAPHNLLFTSNGHEVNKGWNRLQFSSSWDSRENPEVYLQVVAATTDGRPFSIDTEGVPSGHTYAAGDDGTYTKASFDLNSRLLIAAQAEEFDYQVPAQVAVSSVSEGKSSAGFFYWLILLFPLFVTGRQCQH